MVTLDSTRAGYAQHWDQARTLTDKEKAAAKYAATIKANRAQYEIVQRLTATPTTPGVPWWRVGLYHMRESSFDFATHLHNGDSLKARTVHDPAGRPKDGQPPFQWTASAVDALKLRKLDKVQRWSVERGCFEDEGFNGFGVMLYHANHLTGYLWAFTQLYTGGKYTSDHGWDEGAWDKQPGTVAVLKALAGMDASVAAALLDREANPPQDAIDKVTDKERKTRAGGGAAAGAGAANETAGTVAPDSHPFKLPLWINGTVICLGVGLVIFAAILIRRKARLISQRWG